MNRKIIVLVLAIASLVVFLPSEGKAAVNNEATTPFNTVTEYSPNGQVRIRIGQPRRRWNRRWNRGPRRVRVVRQYYYRNGRRYVRTVRVY